MGQAALMKKATAKPSTVHQPDQPAGVLDGLREHRVGQHGEDRAGGEGLDEGHGLLRRPASSE